jgi:hypothetical protein
MSKLTLTDISAEIVDTTTKDSEEVNLLLVRWKVEYYIHHTGGHYWRGTFYWHERNFIIDDVIAAIRKDLPKYTEDENSSK